MPIVVNCKCGKRHELGDDLADATMYCDQCGAMVSLPGPRSGPESRVVVTKRPGKYVRRTIAGNCVFAIVLAVVSLLFADGERLGGKWGRLGASAGFAAAAVALGFWWRLLRRGLALRGRWAVALGTFFFLFGALFLMVMVMVTVRAVEKVGDDSLRSLWPALVFLSVPIAAHVVAAYYHYVDFTAAPGQLRGRVVDNEGVTRDEFAIALPKPAP